MRLLTAITLAFSFTGLACAKKEKKKELYAYEFKVNSCTTGRQSFPSVSSMCEGLSDESRNGGCAYYRRLEEAKKFNCPQVDPQTQVFKTNSTDR